MSILNKIFGRRSCIPSVDSIGIENRISKIKESETKSPYDILNGIRLKKVVYTKSEKVWVILLIFENNHILEIFPGGGVYLFDSDKSRKNRNFLSCGGDSFGFSYNEMKKHVDEINTLHEGAG